MEELLVNDPKVTIWDPLYTRDPHNNLLVWKIWVQNDVVYRTYGRLDGKLREPIGRTIKATSLERSPEKQARLYAERAWLKKTKSGYSPRKEAGDSAEFKEPLVQLSRALEKPDTFPLVFPMYASTYKKTDYCLHKHLELTQGAYIQPKLDGVRCVATRGRDGTATLTSRTGKRFPWFQQICRDADSLLSRLPPSYLGLDGEIYSSTVQKNEKLLDGAERFAVIGGAANIHRKEPSPYEEQLFFYVFDCIDRASTLPQTERFETLDTIFGGKELDKVKKVPTHVIYSPEEATEYHDRFVSAGFEGAVLRAKTLRYTPQRRSLKMRKYKQFDTDEFMIIGAKPGKGTEKGAVVWICSQKEGLTFDCRPAASIDARRAQFEEWPIYVGCLLTVKYQGLSAAKIPRFPVGLEIRQEFIVSK